MQKQDIIEIQKAWSLRRNLRRYGNLLVVKSGLSNKCRYKPPLHHKYNILPISIKQKCETPAIFEGQGYWKGGDIGRVGISP